MYVQYVCSSPGLSQAAAVREQSCTDHSVGLSWEAPHRVPVPPSADSLESTTLTDLELATALLLGWLLPLCFTVCEMVKIFYSVKQPPTGYWVVEFCSKFV